jgi:hypothetical protein
LGSDASGQYGYLVVELAEAQAAQNIPSEKGTRYISVCAAKEKLFVAFPGFSVSKTEM